MPRSFLFGFLRKLFLVTLLPILGMLSGTSPASAEGAVIHYPAFASKFVKARDVSVWLPDGYDPKGPPLPVIYMNDGENLYNSSHSLSGANWGVDVTVSRLIRERKLPPAIVVGIASTDLRGREYLPQKIFAHLPKSTQAILIKGWGGTPLSDEYLKFIVTELKPFIDRTYDTRKDVADTYMVGSSMGGLISFYAQSEYPTIFGGSASLSMHWLLGDPSHHLPPEQVYEPQVMKAFAAYVAAAALPPAGHRVYIDRGTETLDANYRLYALGFTDLMEARGWRRGINFESLVFPGAGHGEAAWNKRLGVPLQFLFATPATPPAQAATSDADYLAYLKTAPAPDAYILSKFRTADVVLLGEDHAVHQNLAFVAAMIPKLYAAGITNLVMEFGAAEDQSALDRLLIAPSFDDAAAKSMMFHYNSMWSWQEYRDLYRAAWTLNRSLKTGAPPFRIVNMSYIYDWSKFDGTRTPASLEAVFPRGVVDGFRANLIAREILDRHQKALILTGTLHAFTRFAMPETHSDSDGFCLRTRNALGNRLFRGYGSRIVNLMFHQTLPDRPGSITAFEQPGDGEVERLMRLNGDRPVGFDLRGSVMGHVPERGYYGLCDADFTLGDFFDGYIFLAPFRELRAATPDLDFVDGAALRKALEQFPDPDWSRRPTDLAGVKAHLQGMADEINARYRTVE